MASFEEHSSQAVHNLKFLEEIGDSDDFWDWKVTVCFYIAVHLMNAHIVQKSNNYFRKHEQVINELNPKNKDSKCSLSIQNYKSYRKLYNLARRSRYLINDNFHDDDGRTCFTFDKHLAKAVKNLDNLLNYFKSEYHNDFPVTKIKCIDLISYKSFNFEVIK